MPKRIQIFRVGKHTDMSGVTHDFNEAMLRESVAAYDPALYTAPLVVGHPKMDAPAYGDVAALHLSDDGFVEIDTANVEPQFAELVNAGRFNRVSASWYLPTAKNNPKPGSMYIKHVGFLGATAPAVKGLKSASFSEQEEGVVEFGDWNDMQVASLFRRMREFIISKFSMEDADGVIPTYAIESLEASARMNEMPDVSTAYSEQEPTMPLTAEQLAAQKQDLDAREQRIKEQERVARTAQHVSFADALIKEGKLLPVHKDGVVAFMNTLESSDVVEFGEGDKKTSQPGVDWFKSFLTAQQKLVSFGEDQRLNAEHHNAIEETDVNSIAKAAVEFQESESKAGRDVSTVDAVTHVLNTKVAK